MKATTVTVRSAGVRDIDRIVEIERSWLHLSHWSIDAYHRLLNDDTFTTSLVAEVEETRAPTPSSAVVGFVIFHSADRTAEIYNIAVERRHARNGVGQALMESVIERARRQGARRLTLEVRKSNSNAIDFYKVFRFRITGERKNYYSNPIEDAYVMEKDLRL